MPLFLLLSALLGCNQEQEPGVVLDMACQNANMDACYQLGVQALVRARPDIRTARNLFAKGCNVHHARSCNGLAEMVRDAKGGPRDPKRAAELFGIACEGGIQSACVELGMFAYDGVGITQDHAKAVELFQAACEHEADPQPKGCSALGVAWSDGNGVEKKDLDVARDYYLRACDADYAPSCVLAGLLAAESRTGKREENRAVAADLLAKACNIDAHFGCYELAVMHEKGEAPEAADAKAAVFFQKTCNIDPTRGCFEAARLMEQGKVSAREGEIESLYNLACEHGHAEACTKRSLEL